MNILMIGWGFPPRIQGGLDIHVYEICRELAKKNHVSLTVPEFNSPGKNLKGIKIIPIKCGYGKNLAKTVREYNRNVVKACKNLDFDVVHSHDWFGVEASEKLKTRAPWVFTLHSLEYMRSCGYGKNSVMERLERKGAKDCDKIITVSRFMKKSIVKNYRMNPKKIEVVYNSARIKKGNPEKIRRMLGLGDRPVVLFLGRLSQQKGVEYLIYSAKSVLEKIPEARFVIAGEGHLKGNLKAFSTHMGLDGKVIFPGFVPEKDLSSYYSAADVFVYPSIFEPFGISVLESLLSGTPVITSKEAGIMESLPEMGSIMDIKPGDSRELADKIVHFLGKRKRVPDKEREILAKTYSWEKSAKELEKIYMKVRSTFSR
ncbi:MAG: glycosyltransferase family 4 protein [Candidatus Aenigmarchaeota archaeon]|nr:glycosyltransferase family 4 protein [Candidatus Aenigmarchaeota archaeon]